MTNPLRSQRGDRTSPAPHVQDVGASWARGSTLRSPYIWRHVGSQEHQQNVKKTATAPKDYETLLGATL
jgi:hypothetical protein